MPKIKSHKGSKKRFKITAKNKIVRCKGFKSHILSKKSSSRKRRLTGKVEVNKTFTKKIKNLIQ